jgi:hypothetical protein
MGYEPAEVTIARMKAPIDDPSFKGFVDAPEPVNALADITISVRTSVDTSPRRTRPSPKLARPAGCARRNTGSARQVCKGVGHG